MRTHLFLLSLCLLASCSNPVVPSPSFTPDWGYDEKTPSLSRNGDIDRDQSEYRLSDVSRNLTQEEATFLIDSNIPFFLYADSSSCNRCKKIEEPLAYFLGQTQTTCYRVSDASLGPFFRFLESNYPSLGILSSEIGTPYGALIYGKQKAEVLSMQSQAYSPSVFSPYLFSKANLSNVYLFAQADSFLGFLEKNPEADYFIGSESGSDTSFYWEHLKKEAPSAVFEWSKASFEDQEKLKEAGYTSNSNRIA